MSRKIQKSEIISPENILYSSSNTTDGVQKVVIERETLVSSGIPYTTPISKYKIPFSIDTRDKFI